MITDLDAGDYVVNVTNIESPAVIGSSDSKSFRVLKASIVLTVSVDDSVYGELSIVNVGSDVDGNYTVNIGDKELVVNVRLISILFIANGNVEFKPFSC